MERQIHTQYYERLLSTHRDELEVKALIEENLPKKPDKFPYTDRNLSRDTFERLFATLKTDYVEQAVVEHGAVSSTSLRRSRLS